MRTKQIINAKLSRNGVYRLDFADWTALYVPEHDMRKVIGSQPKPKAKDLLGRMARMHCVDGMWTLTGLWRRTA